MEIVKGFGFKRDIKYIFSTKYKTIILIVFLNLLSVCFSVIQPRIYKIFVDEVLINKQIHLILYIVCLYLVLFIVLNVLSVIIKHFSNKMMYHINIKTQSKLYSNIFLKDNINQYNAEYLKSIIESDSGFYWKFINLYYLSTPMCIVICIVSLIISYLINPILFISAVVITPASVFTSRKIGKHFNEINREIFKVENKNKSYLSNNIKRWREIKAYNISDPIVEKYETLLKDEKKLKLRWIKAYNFNDIFYSIKNHFFLNIFPYFIGGLLILNQKISIGSLLMFIGYFSMLVNNFDQIVRNYTNILGMQNNFERLRDFINVEEKQKVKINKIYNINFDNVSFKYPTQKNNIISDFNMNINEKDKIWIKGKSGIGKTTLIKLLLRIEHPNEGQITFNGIDVDNIEQTVLHKKIGVIMQENFFFNLTIYDNLRFFNSKVTRNEIEDACKQAHIHYFIISLPNGYNTVVGENGVKLSGGQRQRLAIARMILYNPELVILDEATSALDYYNEQIIYKNLSKLFKDKIVIVISHKNVDFLFTNTLVINNAAKTNLH